MVWNDCIAVEDSPALEAVTLEVGLEQPWQLGAVKRPISTMQLPGAVAMFLAAHGAVYVAAWHA